jgi:hypothetical protein
MIFQWSRDDARLISSAADGHSIVWDMTTYQSLIAERVGSSAFCVALAAKGDFSAFYIARSDRKIYEMGSRLESVFATAEIADSAPACLALWSTEHTQFVALGSGYVRAYPLSPSDKYTEVSLRSASVTSLRVAGSLPGLVSPSGSSSYVLTPSMDGVAFITTLSADTADLYPVSAATSTAAAGAGAGGGGAGGGGEGKAREKRERKESDMSGEMREEWVEEVQVVQMSFSDTMIMLFDLEEETKPIEQVITKGIRLMW